MNFIFTIVSINFYCLLRLKITSTSFKHRFKTIFFSKNSFVCFTCPIVISDWLVSCLHNCRFVHGLDGAAHAFQMHVSLHGPLRLTAWFLLTPNQGFLCTYLTLLYIFWDFIKLNRIRGKTHFSQHS